MLAYLVGLPSCFLLYLLWRLSRPVAGGKRLEDWARDGELSRVPRSRLGENAAFLANGFYCVCDKEDLTAKHVSEESALEVQALGREFRVWRDSDGEVFAKSASGKWWLTDESHNLVLVWYQADGFAPTYRISDGKEPIPSEFVCHGKTQHTVRCLMSDIPENGADYAHFKAVHEDGSKAFGLLAGLAKLELKFNGKWEVR